MTKEEKENILASIDSEIDWSPIDRVQGRTIPSFSKVGRPSSGFWPLWNKHKTLLHENRYKTYNDRFAGWVVFIDTRTDGSVYAGKSVFEEMEKLRKQIAALRKKSD